MSAGNLRFEPPTDQPLAFAPRPAARCGCAEHEVMASRDEDGDWTCLSCGRLVGHAVTRLRALRAAHESPGFAAQCAGSRR
jgi:hypothetical protein